jgi:hypothetical protein
MPLQNAVRFCHLRSDYSVREESATSQVFRYPRSLGVYEDGFVEKHVWGCIHPNFY